MASKARSAVHAEPKNLPKIDGPFATPTSRAGGTQRVVTTQDELRSVSLEELYKRSALVRVEKAAREYSEELNKKVVLWVDAVVNAANRKLLGGGGIDGALHRAAGEELTYECSCFPVKEVRGTYQVRIEAGEKHVIHTVGPDLRKPLRMGNVAATPRQHAQHLMSCYAGSLKLAVDHKLKSIAFSAISTGVFGYDVVDATRVALATVRDFLETPQAAVMDLVVFAVFDQRTVDAYAQTLPAYFPPPPRRAPEGPTT
ncbi:macro domain-containing protein [Pseudohyphozyma bogoriensis]|nr:macro domain-containing protein [Pseudohyphozyma bogoriensis]